MIYLTFKSKVENDVFNEISLHVGQTIPFRENEQIHEIQVDGHEKGLIDSLFPFLKINKRVAIYTGPFAELIFSNIRGCIFGPSV